VTNYNKKAVLSQGNGAMPLLFFSGLKFADNIHHKFNSSHASFESQASELQTYRRKTEFNAKWPLKVIQDHLFWSL